MHFKRAASFNTEKPLKRSVAFKLFSFSCKDSLWLYCMVLPCIQTLYSLIPALPFLLLANSNLGTQLHDFDMHIILRS